VKVLFSPQGGISKELLRLIKAAKVEINLAAYAFSSKYLGNVLTAAQKRGVKVRIILDRDNADQAYSIDEWLIQQGIDTRFVQVKSGCMHHKFMIIDAKMLMTGSYNFTNESEFRNYEAALFTNSKPLIKSFTTEFERLWLLSLAPSLPVPAPPTFGGTGDYGGLGAISKI